MVQKITDRGNFDLHEKMNLICSNSSRIVRNEAFQHKNRPKANHPHSNLHSTVSDALENTCAFQDSRGDQSLLLIIISWC